MGHIPDDPPPTSPDLYLIQDFLKCSRPLWSLALTCRRFRDVAQEYLLCAPVIGGFVTRSPQQRSTSRIAFLIRTLFARPELRRHVRQIRLCFPEGRVITTSSGYHFVSQVEDQHESNAWAEALDFANIVRQSRETVMSLDLPEGLQRTWNAQLFLDFRYAMIGILLALLPQIECLSVSEQDLRPNIDDHAVVSLIGVQSLIPGKNQVDLRGIQCLPAASSLRRLKISSMLPLRFEGLDLFPNLRTLDFGIKLAGSDSRTIQQFEKLFAKAPLGSTSLHRIEHLRLDCQIKTAGIWDFSARVGMAHILKAFPTLISLDFYAEPSNEKNPFRSVRAFPHYQANIQSYPDDPTPEDRDTILSLVWDERVYDARTEWTNYQYLVDSLIHMRPHLQRLKLPGGFWTLPGAMRKPLPSFTSFPQLQSLDLPQAALLSIKLDKMRFAETEHGDFELLPKSVLPPKLRRMKIFDADIKLLQSAWLQQLFGEQASWGTWPDLEKLEILFGPTLSNVEAADLFARRTWRQFWTLVDKATFQVLIARDCEVPSVCM